MMDVDCEVSGTGGSAVAALFAAVCPGATFASTRSRLQFEDCKFASFLHLSIRLSSRASFAMGRARTKTKKSKPVITENTSEPPQPPSVSALLEKAQTLIVQYDYNLAERFVKRVLEREPQNVEAIEMLGVVQLETGELDSAKQVLRISITLCAFAERNEIR